MLRELPSLKAWEDQISREKKKSIPWRGSWFCCDLYHFLGKFSRHVSYFSYFFFFFQKIDFDIPCKLPEISVHFQGQIWKPFQNVFCRNFYPVGKTGYQWLINWKCRFTGTHFSSMNISLTLSTLGKIFSRRHFEIFFLFFPINRIWHFMQIVS